MAARDAREGPWSGQPGAYARCARDCSHGGTSHGGRARRAKGFGQTKPNQLLTHIARVAWTDVSQLNKPLKVAASLLWPEPFRSRAPRPAHDQQRCLKQPRAPSVRKHLVRAGPRSMRRDHSPSFCAECRSDHARYVFDSTSEQPEARGISPLH